MVVAENRAATLGATVISNSYGAFEFEGEGAFDSAYNHPGIPITVSTGDEGYATEYPSTSPYVIAVGGTSLKKDTGGTRGWSEEVWAGAGSGCSLYEAKPVWQKDTGCSKRTVSDVSAVADPYTGVSVYNSFEAGGWAIYGGTSVSAPLVAGIEALYSSATRAAGAEAFYKTSTSLFDVTVGINGLCTPPQEKEYLCTGELAFDGPTGNGTPNLTPTGKPLVASRAEAVTKYTAQLKGRINPEGSETHYRFEFGKTTAYGQQAPLGSEPLLAAGSAPVSVSQTAYALDPEQQYHYRLVATNSKGTTFGEDHVFSTPGKFWAPQATYASSFGTLGTGNGQFKNPTGIAVEPTSGAVVVSEEGNDRIQLFGPSGEFIRKFGSEGTADGQFRSPLGVATDAKGNIWVADTENNRIQEFTEKGEFIRKFGSEGTANGQFKLAADVAVDAKGNVWVADLLNYRVQEFTETGTWLRSFSTGAPTYGVAVDSKGNVWSSSLKVSGMIEEHSETGTLIRSFGKTGEGTGEIRSPRGLTVDALGDVWVVDGENNRVQVFSETGEYLAKFGSLGTGAGQMSFPFDVALDPRGNVWVSDYNNARVQKWMWNG
jgi:DNA-binding beta-propeller fold protein YncE